MIDERRNRDRKDGRVWTDDERDYYRAHGIERDEHLAHHAYLESKARKEKFWADLWRSLLHDNAKRAVSAVFWFLMLAIVLGATGAWEAVMSKLTGG